VFSFHVPTSTSAAGNVYGAPLAVFCEPMWLGFRDGRAAGDSGDRVPRRRVAHAAQLGLGELHATEVDGQRAKARQRHQR
jgi:hypothetical protein